MYKHISKIINNGKRNSNVLNNIPELAQKTLTEIVEIINNQFATIYTTYIHLIQLITENYTYKLLEKYLEKPRG